MNIGRLLTVVAILIGLAIAACFVAYHFLTLSGEYRTLNFQHHAAIQRALQIVWENTPLGPGAIDQIRAEIESAMAISHGCLNNLAPLERALTEYTTDGKAFDACRDSLALNGAIVANLGAAGGPNVDLLKADLSTSLGISEAFHDMVAQTEIFIRRGVLAGSVGTALVISVAFFFMRRAFVATWRAEKRVRRALADESRRLQMALEAPGEGMALYDENWRLKLFNRAYAVSAHPDPDFVAAGAAIGDIFRDAVSRGHYPDVSPEAVDDFIANQLGRIGESAEGCVLRTAGDRFIRVRQRRTGVGDTIVTRADVTDYVHAQRHVAKAADTDGLTGLPNRRRFDRVLAERGVAGIGSIIRIDLDRFKSVNDVLGHAAGDHVLRVTADLLKSGLAEDHVAARIGGDEFVVLCPAGTDEAHGLRVAERLRAAIERPVDFEGKICQFGASFGVAASAADHGGPGDILRDADIALYEAKADGRGCIRVFDAGMKGRARTTRILADALPDAIADGAIEPYFQTQHDAASKAVTGVEVLARWVHPDLGLVAPSVFLPIARQLGLEAEIDRVMFERGMAVMKTLDARGQVLPSMSFNLSSSRLLDPKFLETLDEAGFQEPSRIAFEIVETVSAEELGDDLLFVLDGLRARGFRIEIDDFGSDAASLNGLFRIGPEAVKLDRALIQLALASDPGGDTIRSIVQLSHSLGLRVIAEGVESGACVDFLASAGCDILQGFHFSQPMPESALTDLLDNSVMKPRAA